MEISLLNAGLKYIFIVNEHAVGLYILLSEDGSIKLVKQIIFQTEVASCKLTNNSNVSKAQNFLI